MTEKNMILVVEDDKGINRFISLSLESQGYRCLQTSLGKEAIALTCSYNPEIVILDLGLPDMDGLEVIKKLKELSTCKIIVVSARDHERQKVEALDLGADDYLTKPFSLAELLARVRVALRNTKQFQEINTALTTIANFDDLSIDYDRHRVSVADEEVHLTPIEYKILEILSKNPGRVLTHKYISEIVWNSFTEYESNNLRVFMANIRRKIEKNPAQPKYILTEVGIGYRFNEF